MACKHNGQTHYTWVYVESIHRTQPLSRRVYMTCSLCPASYTKSNKFTRAATSCCCWSLVLKNTGMQHSLHSFTSQRKRRRSWLAIMLQNSTKSYKITSNDWSAPLQRFLSITAFRHLAFCSQNIHGNIAKMPCCIVPRPVQSRCCLRKAPLRRLVCCPTPARMHSPLRQICELTVTWMRDFTALCSYDAGAKHSSMVSRGPACV